MYTTRPALACGNFQAHHRTSLGTLGSMLARRFSLPPVHEPSYEPRHIPNAQRDMSGTVLVCPPREVWLTMLGEMCQIVNEAVRRRAAAARDASKVSHTVANSSTLMHHVFVPSAHALKFDRHPSPIPSYAASVT